MREAVDGLEFVFWMATEVGPIKVIQSRQEAVFFIEDSSVQMARNLLSGFRFRDKALALKSFGQQAVWGFYFLSWRELRRAASLLDKHRIAALEHDIRPVDRYLMERFITSSVLIDGALESPSQQCADIHLNNARLRPVSHPVKKASSDDCLPVSLKVVSFDIETSMNGEFLYSIAVHKQKWPVATSADGDILTVSQVFMVGGNQSLDFPVEFHATERGLLTAFLAFVQAHDPDILIGWNCINFDLRFLERKCQTLHMPFAIGREGAVAEWRNSANSMNQHFVFIPGRAVLDGIDTLKTATWQFESYSLESVARQLLNRGKLIHQVDDRGREITRLFNEDKLSLAKYNLEDCVLVWDIFEKTQLIQFALQRSRLTGLPLDKVGGSVLAFENLYLPRLHRQGYVAPNLIKNPQGVGSPGGYVMDSVPGLYESILVFDFKSLYPSIIRTFRVDPYSLVEGDRLHFENSHSQSSERQHAAHAGYIEGFRNSRFRISGSILPGMIEEIWQARDAAKKANNQPLSQALKILMNSFYGVMGTPGCRFFDARLPSSITVRGHEILVKTRKLFETEGYRVIYGDTDSIFVLAQSPLSFAQASALGKSLTEKFNAWWQQEIKTQHGVNSTLELEYEAHYRKFVMPRIRGSLEGSKKRYAGLICTQDFNPQQPAPGTYTLVFKGLEAVRTDWTKAARQFQQELYKRVFLGQPWQDFVQRTIQDLRQGKLDEQLVFRKRLRRRLSEYQKNIPPHAQAAIKAEQQGKKLGLPERYAQGGWIEYLYSLNGPEPLEFMTAAIDYELYVERQILPIVEGIACFLDGSYGNLASAQLSLL
jgi:DNA polymerase-2